MKDWEMVILTLEGCKYCEHLKEKLNELNIPYINIDAIQNSELADKLEQYYGCDSYPMIILNKPYNIIWLSKTVMELSSNIRVFNTIEELTKDIFKIFNQ